MAELKYTDVLDLLPDQELLRLKGLDPEKDGLVLYAASQVISILKENPENQEIIELLIAGARKNDPFCAKVLDDVLAFYDAKGVSPGVLAMYAQDKKDGKITPRGGKSKWTHFFRNLIIWDAVEALRSEGVSENSAAQIISMELKNRGHDIGQEAVRQIRKKPRETGTHK